MFIKTYYIKMKKKNILKKKKKNELNAINNF